MDKDFTSTLTRLSVPRNNNDISTSSVDKNDGTSSSFQDPGQGTVPEEEVTVPPRKVNGGQSEKKSLIDSTSKFLDDFNPHNSEREKRKKTTIIFKSAVAPSLFDAKGVLIEFQKDLCDCLIDNCTGCHFPCPKCRSDKCGHECRQNRKWQYETRELEGQPDTLATSSFLVKKL